MSSAAQMKAKVLAEIGRTRSPTRAQLSWRTAICIAVGVAITAVMIGGNGPNAGARAPMFMTVVAFILLSLAARILIAAVSSSLWVSARGAQRLVAMPYAALAAVAIAYARGPSLPHSLAGDLPCAEKTIMLAAIVGIAAIIARRATEPIKPLLKGLLLGSFAAVIGAMWIFLACPLEEPLHFAIGHLGGALIAGGLLGGLASRLIRA